MGARVSRRLDRAREYLASIPASESPMRATYLCKPQDLLMLRYAGSAVLEVFEFCTGLAHAYDVPPPILNALSPLEGEDARAWATRATESLVAWHGAQFHGSLELSERKLEARPGVAQAARTEERPKRAEQKPVPSDDGEQHHPQRRTGVVLSLVSRLGRARHS